MVWESESNDSPVSASSFSLLQVKKKMKKLTVSLALFHFSSPRQPPSDSTLRPAPVLDENLVLFFSQLVSVPPTPSRRMIPLLLFLSNRSGRRTDSLALLFFLLGER